MATNIYPLKKAWLYGQLLRSLITRIPLRIEINCKELSIFNVDALRRKIKLQTIFHKLFAQGHTSCRLKCPYEMYSWLCTYLLSSLLRKPFIPYLCFFFVDNDIMHTITLVSQITFVLFSFYYIIVPCIVIVFQMWEKVSSH